jgi:hypothetical protein
MLQVGAGALASAQCDSVALPANDSLASAQGATAASPEAEATAPSLTERVRALFENSALPVREIARLAGVTERTIYKYAAKQQWKPRYRWNEGKAGERHRGWNAEAAFTPVKGAGGRFVARARAGEAHPVGLKATDPAGAAQAAAACVRAGEAVAAAQAEAGRIARAEACIAAIAQVHAALARLNAQERKRCLECLRRPHSKASRQRASGAGNRGETGRSDRLSMPLLVGANFALLVWERALREME